MWHFGGKSSTDMGIGVDDSESHPCNYNHVSAGEPDHVGLPARVGVLGSSVPPPTYFRGWGTEKGGTTVGEMVFFPMTENEELSWQERGLCAQTDPEAFFPEKGGSTREAKRVCLSCDVRSECLEYALANDERFGIWGGLSERERRRLKKAAG